MSQDDNKATETLEQLVEYASLGDWNYLLKLIRKSNDSKKAAVMAADLLFEGTGKIRPDAEAAFAFYYIAALDGDQHSLDILTDNSNFDRDADYYLNLTKTETVVKPKIEDLVDLEKLFRIQGTELPGEKEKTSKKPKRERPQLVLSEETIRLKDERDRLNGEIKIWVQKRDELNEQNKEIVKKAGKCKEERDEFNRKVKEAKIKRDEANKKVIELSQNTPGMRADTNNSLNQPSLKQLKKEFNELDYKHRTQVLKKKEEEALVKKMKEIDTQIREKENDQCPSDGIRGKSNEFRDAKDEADKWHKLVSEYAEKAQSKHDEMERLYQQADTIRKEADEAHRKFIESKKRADEAHNKFLESKKRDMSKASQ